MGRPRAYDLETALGAVRDVFWERGYEQVSISDLEQRTGLDRSSLYNAFGSKHALFEAVLQRYEEEVRTGLSRMRESGPGLDAVAGFFTDAAARLRSDSVAGRRGCLIVNTIAEFGCSDSLASSTGERYRDALRDAFVSALDRAAERGEVDRRHNRARARALAATVMGYSLAARLDPLDAAETCEAVAAEVQSWRLRAPSRSKPKAPRS